jgi:hypothetical protein
LPGRSRSIEFTITPYSHPGSPRGCILPTKEVLEALEQTKSDSEVALELMRLVLEQAGSRRLSPTRTLALYHLCKEAVAYNPEGPVTATYLEDELKKLLQ